MFYGGAVVEHSTHNPTVEQGTLTEGKGLVQLTSLY